LTWYVTTVDTSDNVIAPLLDFASVKIIGENYLKVYTRNGMKDKLKNSYGVISISRTK
jgi:hypothetical protein